MQNIELIIMIVVILTNGCVVSSSQQEKKHESVLPGEQSAQLREAKPQEIPFDYDPDEFVKVEMRTEPKAIAQEGIEGFPVEAPAHSCFYLEDKRPLPAFEKGPRYFYPAYSSVCVIPLADASTTDFAKAYPYLSEAAVKLRKILELRPRKFKDHEDIHDLPFNNASQAIQSKVQYTDFRTGTGVLFLTQYSQEMWPNPANNEELTCNFQGLTRDGKYYIAARFAITHPSLPRGIDFTEHIERDKNRIYLRKDEKKLNSFREESFQPSLRALKALISSISVQ